jgi:hypothetical protein
MITDQGYASLEIAGIVENGQPDLIEAEVEDPKALLSSMALQKIPLFEYSPLSSPSDIRLVVLEPGSSKAPVRCRLIHVSLDKNPKYEALSYTWGDPSMKGSRIFLDDKIFQVGMNLNRALVNLRDEDMDCPKERRLWIDAICINQADITERNEQVQRMKMIYSKAIRVVIWLGSYQEDLDNLLEFDEEDWGFHVLKPAKHEEISRAYDLLRYLSTPSSTYKDVQTLVAESAKSATKQDWANCRRLLMRPWFERIWVIQEIFVAQEAKVVCGRLILDWREFSKASEVMIVQSYQLPWSDDLKFILQSVEWWRALTINVIHRMPSRTMLALLHRLQNYKCTNPRDRIFALLGVCDDAHGVKVDYGSSVQDFYINWAWVQIDKTRRLDVFCYCNDSSSLGLPSWVPHLEEGPLNLRNDFVLLQSSICVDPSTVDDFAGQLLYAASGRSLSSPKISDDRLCLSVSGMNIDTINAVLDMKDGPDPLDMIIMVVATKIRFYLLARVYRRSISWFEELG